MNKIKKKRARSIIKDLPLEEWRAAPPPNYVTNTDLHFPYSEYPRTFDTGYEYYSIKLTAQDFRSRILDFWGEGRVVDGDLVTGFKNAYNVNHQFKLVCIDNDPNFKPNKIPNRIPTVDYDNVSVAKYVPDGSVDIITLMGAPINEPTAAEIKRMIHVDAHTVIVIYGFNEQHEYITNLEVELDSISFVLSPLYALNSQLNEVTLEPKLAFCMASVVIQQATVYFQNIEMSKCATILCSLLRSSHNQPSVKGALRDFFAKDGVKNSYLIFKLGYALIDNADGLAVMDNYMNSNVVKIVKHDYNTVKIVSNFSSETAYLCTNGAVPDGKWQWAFMASSGYLNSNPSYKGAQNLSVYPVNGGESFNVESQFGSSALLCTNREVPVGKWQYAFFGTYSYLYDGGENFRLIPIDGGNRFQIQSNFGDTAYLCPDGRVLNNSWQWAFFGTYAYLDNDTYRGGDEFSFEFS